MMPKKNPWWCKMDFQEFRHHYKKMTDEAALADLRESCEAVDDLDDSGTSWGALCVRSAKERLGKLSPVNAANAKSSGGDPQRGDGGSGHEGESPATPADAAQKTHKLTPAELTFERFRRAFGGNKRGLDSEFKNFVRKNKDWQSVLPSPMPALEIEKEWRKRCTDVGAFCPEWTMLSTWINQRRWEQELAEPSAPAVQKTARQLENEKNERETAEWIQSLGKEKNAEPKGFLDDLSRDILGGIKNGQ